MSDSRARTAQVKAEGRKSYPRHCVRVNATYVADSRYRDTSDAGIEKPVAPPSGGTDIPA
jgi:hypothetical protein